MNTNVFGHSYDNWAAKTGLRTDRTQNSANLFIWIDPVVTAISSFYFFHLSFFIELSRFNQFRLFDGFYWKLLVNKIVLTAFTIYRLFNPRTRHHTISQRSTSNTVKKRTCLSSCKMLSDIINKHGRVWSKNVNCFPYTASW